NPAIITIFSTYRGSLTAMRSRFHWRQWLTRGSRPLRADRRLVEEATMNHADTIQSHMLEIRELTAEAFAPYGQVIAPLRTGGQDAETNHDRAASFSEAKLVLGN